MANLKRPKLAVMLFAAALCIMPANGETITYYNNENPDDILNSSQFEIDSYLETATLTKFQNWYDGPHHYENVVIPETFEHTPLQQLAQTLFSANMATILMVTF